MLARLRRKFTLLSPAVAPLDLAASAVHGQPREGALEVVDALEASYTASMPQVVFTPQLERFLACKAQRVQAGSVREALERVFVEQARLRGYILDDQGGLRQHIAVFVDGQQLSDRATLTDPVGEDSEIYVMQALSGG